MDSEALYSESVTSRVTRATMAMIDMYAHQEQRKRADMIRKLISEAVTARQASPSPLTPLQHGAAARRSVEDGDAPRNYEKDGPA